MTNESKMGANQSSSPIKTQLKIAKKQFSAKEKKKLQEMSPDEGRDLKC